MRTTNACWWKTPALPTPVIPILSASQMMARGMTIITIGDLNLHKILQRATSKWPFLLWKAPWTPAILLFMLLKHPAGVYAMPPLDIQLRRPSVPNTTRLGTVLRCCHHSKNWCMSGLPLHILLRWTISSGPLHSQSDIHLLDICLHTCATQHHTWSIERGNLLYYTSTTNCPCILADTIIYEYLYDIIHMHTWIRTAFAWAPVVLLLANTFTAVYSNHSSDAHAIWQAICCHDNWRI